MKKSIIIVGAITAILTGSISNINSINSKTSSQSMVCNFQLTLINNTDNVKGGTPYHFGTWFYLDLSVNGKAFNDNSLNNITRENPQNAGGSGGSAGRTGDLDVFIIPIKAKETIFNMNFDSQVQYSFTLGTFYWTPLYWGHTILTSFDSPTYVFPHCGATITAMGTNGNNSATFTYYWRH